MPAPLIAATPAIATGLSKVAAWIGGGTALTNLGFNIFDRFKQNKHQKQYQKNIDITRNREDNAISRMTEDYKNAGMNPLLATGSSGLQASQPQQTTHEQGQQLDNMSVLLGLAHLKQSQAQTEHIGAETDFLRAQSNHYTSMIKFREENERRREEFVKSMEKVTLQREALELRGTSIDNQIRHQQTQLNQLESRSRQLGIHSNEIENARNSIKLEVEQATRNIQINKIHQDELINNRLIRWHEININTLEHNLNESQGLGLRTTDSINRSKVIDSANWLDWQKHRGYY